jgi:type IV secretory pathway protease TraF
MFVIGTHPLSYDSKYFGFVDKSQILRRAKPL